LSAYSHRVTFAALACSAALIVVGAPRTDEDAAEVAAAPVLGDPYPPRETHFGRDVAARADVVYATPPGFRPLRLDLYRPNARGAARPLVVYVHGGGWRSGHTRHAGAFADWPAVLASVARRGYVVASIEYRLSGEARFPAALEDVKAAVRWLRSRAGEFGIDRNRVVIWGGSAGGHLAALAAASCDAPDLAPKYMDAALQKESDCVQGLVAWYGVFDLRAATASHAPADVNAPAASFLGCSPDACPEAASLASPTTHVGAGHPPTLLIHGEDDRVVPVSQSRTFQAALEAKGVRSRLIVLPEVDHSFIGKSAASTRTASLEALAETLAFIDAATGEKRP
jgi:acetyl esterase/lipase